MVTRLPRPRICPWCESCRVPPQSWVSVARRAVLALGFAFKVPVSGLPAASKNPTEAPRHRPRCRLWPSAPNTSSSVASSTQRTSASPLRVWRVYWRIEGVPRQPQGRGQLVTPTQVHQVHDVLGLIGEGMHGTRSRARVLSGTRPLPTRSLSAQI